MPTWVVKDGHAWLIPFSLYTLPLTLQRGTDFPPLESMLALVTCLHIYNVARTSLISEATSSKFLWLLPGSLEHLPLRYLLSDSSCHADTSTVTCRGHTYMYSLSLNWAESQQPASTEPSWRFQPNQDLRWYWCPHFLQQKNDSDNPHNCEREKILVLNH